MSVFLVFLRQGHALERSEFEWTQELSGELLKLCPDGECLLVGVGPSTTPVVAYLEAKVPVRPPAYLPLKRFSFGVGLGVPHLSFEDEKKLSALFRELLPEEFIPASRKLLLFEISGQGGEYLAAVRTYLEAHSNRERLRLRLSTAVVVPERDRLRTHPSLDFALVMHHPSLISRATRFDRFEMKSKYPAFQIDRTESLMGRDYLPRLTDISLGYQDLVSDFKNANWPKPEEGLVEGAIKVTERISPVGFQRATGSRSPSTYLSHGGSFPSRMGERLRNAFTLKWRLAELDFEQRVVELLNDPDPEVRRIVCHELFSGGGFTELRRLLLTALKSDYLEVKEAAVTRLTSRTPLAPGEESSSEQFESFKFLLDRVQPPEVRRAASRRISAQSDSVRMMLVALIAREEDPAIRALGLVNLVRPIVAKGRLQEIARWFEYLQEDFAKGVPGEQIGWIEGLGSYRVVVSKKLNPFLGEEFKEKFKIKQ